MVSLAWRILTHRKGRTLLALVGMFMAILLVFIQLGLFYAVPQGGMLLYDNMRFDLLLVSDQYEYQAQPGAFALSRLDQVRASPEVAAATALYFGVAKWKGGAGGAWPDLFVIGVDPQSRVFLPRSIERQRAALERPDTILVDSASRSIFGPLDTGRVVDLGDRAVTIGGHYRLGTGFMGLGVALASTANFAPAVSGPRPGPGQSRPDRAEAGGRPRGGGRFVAPARRPRHADLHPRRTRRSRRDLLDDPDLGRADFRLGLADFDRGRDHGRLPDRFHPGEPANAAIRDLEGDRLWRRRARRHGGDDVAADRRCRLRPGAAAAAAWLYRLIQQRTMLPVTMTLGHVAAVLGAALGMAAVSALLALGGLRRADPADVF